MSRYKLVLLLLSCFIGCKDNPFMDPVETVKTNYEFSGIVELGTPISGATIVAHEFSGLKKGEKIGEAISNLDGTFDLKFMTSYDGPLLLTASGGLYQDLATGETIALKPFQELSSAITHIKMPEKTNINAWTSMAVARVLANRGFWDKGVAELEDIDRINVDFSHVSYFLSGKSTNFINIRRLDFFDAKKESFILDDPKVTLHLAHGGLSQLAKRLTTKLASEGIVISVVDLLDVLREDLTDRIFDGRKADGSMAFVGNNHRINLSSYTMRKDLSEAILLYLRFLQGVGKLTEEDKRSLEIPGRMVDSIARDDRPEFFPSSEQPKPLDREPPTILVHFVNEHRSEKQFAFLNGNVSFDVEVQDDSEIQELKMLEPQIAQQGSGSTFGPILVNHIPQAMAAARACGKADALREELGKRELSEENVICACFEAVDVFDNASRELGCFQRAVPKSMISFPTNQTVLSSKNFSDGVKVKAKISSSMPLSECSWRIQFEGEMEEGVLPSGNGVIEGTSCHIDEAIDGANFFDGNYHFQLHAEDLGGRVLSDKQGGNYQSITSFQIFKSPPSVEIVSPSNNGYLAKNFIPIFGSASAPERIQGITASFRGIGLHNQDFKGSARVALRQDSKEWAVSLGENLSAGEYALELMVKDIYGNEKKLAARTITIDKHVPIISGALEGVPQNAYSQETMNYRQRLVDNRYLIKPVEQASPISWRKIPTIYRWLARLDDWSTAPGYTIKATDDNKLKEVRYKIDHKCASLDEADKMASGQDGRYDIRFTQSAASFDLSGGSEGKGQAQKYCLSIWAIDEAGNASNEQVEFFWKVVASPVALDMNAARYTAHAREDDISWVGPPVWKLFRNRNPIALKKDLVIGHVIMSNPFSSPISTKLELKKALELKISKRQYLVPEKDVDIRYFTYDLIKNQVGGEKTLNDGSVIINGNQTVVAKFILAKEIPINGIENPGDNFWQTFSLRLGFAKTGNDRPVVDGLKLITRDTGTGTLSTEFVVPWGSDHDVRRRSAPQVIAPRNIRY